MTTDKRATDEATAGLAALGFNDRTVMQLILEDIQDGLKTGRLHIHATRNGYEIRDLGRGVWALFSSDVDVKFPESHVFGGSR